MRMKRKSLMSLLKKICLKMTLSKNKARMILGEDGDDEDEEEGVDGDG